MTAYSLSMFTYKRAISLYMVAHKLSMSACRLSMFAYKRANKLSMSAYRRSMFAYKLAMSTSLTAYRLSMSIHFNDPVQAFHVYSTVHLQVLYVQFNAPLTSSLCLLR